MELFEENKSESDEKKSIERNLVIYNTDTHVLNMLKDILYESRNNEDTYENFEEISMKTKIKAKKRPFEFVIPQQISNYKPELSSYEESVLVSDFIIPNL